MAVPWGRLPRGKLQIFRRREGAPKESALHRVRIEVEQFLDFVCRHPKNVISPTK